jgi:hypothetical protein
MLVQERFANNYGGRGELSVGPERAFIQKNLAMSLNEKA